MHTKFDYTNLHDISLSDPIADNFGSAAAAATVAVTSSATTLTFYSSSSTSLDALPLYTAFHMM